MATRSGGSKSTGGSRKRTTVKAKPKPKRQAGRLSRARRAGARRRAARPAAPRPAARTRACRRFGGARAQPHRARVERDDAARARPGGRRRRGQARADDRDDANELVSNLVSRGRKADRRPDARPRETARAGAQGSRGPDDEGPQGDEAGAPPGSRPAAAGRVGRVARDAADRPLAAGRPAAPRAPGPAGRPITGYDQLTAAQVKARLEDLNKADLRKVRDAGEARQGRKSILDAIESSGLAARSQPAAARPSALACDDRRSRALAERLREQLLGRRAAGPSRHSSRSQAPASGSANQRSPKRSRSAARQCVSSAQARR